MKRSHVAVLGALLAAAVVLRAAVAGGALGWDDVQYWEAARAIRHGDLAPTSMFRVRYGVVVPLVATQALFGETELAATLVPLLYSLALLVTTYALGSLYGGPGAGLLAAALLAALPLDVIQATDVHTDLPIAVFWALTMYAVKRGEMSERRPLGWFVAGGLCLGLAQLTKEIGGLFLVVLAARLAWRRRDVRAHLALVLAFLGVVAAELAWMAWSTGDPFHRFALGRAHFQEMVSIPAIPGWMSTYAAWLLNPLDGYFGITGGIGYLALAAGVWGWHRRDTAVGELALWWAVLFLPLNFLPLDPSFERPLFIRFPRTLHPLVVPLVLAAGVWLARGLAGHRRVRAGLLTAFALVSALGIWTLAQDRTQWAAVARQAAPLIERAGSDVLLVTDSRSAWLLRVLLPGRRERIVVYSDVEMASLPGATLVLTDPVFLRSEQDRDPPPAAMLAPPPAWERVADLPRPRRIGLRRLVLGLGRAAGEDARTRPLEATGPMATLWRLPARTGAAGRP